MSLALYALLTVIALALAVVFAGFAGVHVRRLERRSINPVGEQIGSAKAVVRKVRKGEAMSPEELEFARQLVAARSSPWTFAIPGALFMIGCFYVFGSLYHLNGATPSERTFLGVFPMLASVNFTTQILRSIRVKKRLQKTY
jgi:hypothetical protein